MGKGNNFSLPRFPRGELGMLGLVGIKPAQILSALELVVFVLFLLFILNSPPAPTFVSAQTSPDAIAIRVIPNPAHYSPLHWYQNQGFTGSPQSLIVDGYEAVRDGRTVYVNAANVDLNTNTLYTNIYLISYNQNAESATVDIFGRILGHWKFNTNVSGAGNCSQATSKDCLMSSDCGGSEYCTSLKSRIIRDTKRLSELVEVKLKLAEFKQSNNRYPKLDSGTYLTNKTISVWPSWQETLAKELNYTLPIDPINKLGVCPGYDSTTCWDEQTKKFADPTPNNGIFNLPDNSNAFVYTTDAQGAAYNICANMESGLISLTMGNCIGNIIANNPPVINGINLPTVGSGKEYIGYVSATDPDGDILSWSINTGGTTWTGWSALPVLQPAGTNSQKKIYAAKTGSIGAYDFYITVSDGRGGSYTNPTAYQIIIGNCVDSDSDGYGVCPNCGMASGCLNNGNDCDDAKNYINPGSAETCDNNDNNCDSQTDEGCDDDSDNYCDNSMKFYNNPVAACPNSNLTNGSWGDDCDDGKNNINSSATEICGNGIDEDCNGSDLSCATTCTDNDADGYGSPASTACAYATLDCNDSDGNIKPGAPDICDGIDNDCDGTVDNNCDKDNDNYCDCSQPFTFGSDLTAICSGTNTTDITWWNSTCDCNDNNIGISPGATEDCENGIDEDCDGSDLACVVTCIDNDGDGYGNPTIGCARPQLDCDDNNININPGAVENCTNIIDDNCDTNVDCADAQCFADPSCVASCGNGACDVAGGECSSCAGDCTIAACCGNIIVDFTGEECDDGKNGIDTDECTDSCAKTYCGDWTVQNNPQNGDGIAEECDDGNTTAGDGCDDNCQIEIVACIPKPLGMVSWWPGDNNANDIQDGNNGAAVGSVGYVAGKVGQAFDLLPPNHITVTDPFDGSLDFGTGDFSAAAWIKTSNSGHQGIINKLSGSEGNNFHVNMDEFNTGKIQFMIHDAGTDYSLIGNTAVADGQWHHIGIVVDWSTFPSGAAYIYIDGTLDQGGLIANIGTSLSNSTDLTIGDIPWGALYEFNGLIDEVMVFNRALSAAEVQAIYDAGSYGVCK